MKLFFRILFVCCAFTFGMALAQDVHVPDVGSVWESVVEYNARDDGSRTPPKREVVVVDRMENGRPVFAGMLFNQDGEIIESSVGTTIYALECKSNILKEHLVPPRVPNQCGGHVCRAPPVGETIIRTMFVYIPMYGCQPIEATYSFVSLRTEGSDEQEVTVGKASIMRGFARLGRWVSHIRSGIGEVYSESLERKTTYEKVVVPLVPYRNGLSK